MKLFRRDPSKRVLKWVNRQRRSLGQDRLRRLKHGHRRNEFSCPIARSLSNGYTARVSQRGITIYDADNMFVKYIVNPVFVLEWITAFDNGHYPKFIRG